MGGSLAFSVLAAVLTYGSASSLADSRKALCSQPPAPSQLYQPQPHPQWLSIDWQRLLKGNFEEAFTGLEPELVLILASLAAAFFLLTWAQLRLKKAPHFERQPLSRTSVLLLFVLLITAFKSFLSAQAFESSARSLLCSSLSIISPNHPKTSGFTELERSSALTLRVLIDFDNSWKRLLKEEMNEIRENIPELESMRGLASESYMKILYAEEMLYSIHFFPTMYFGKMLEYFQPQDLLLPLRVYQQISKFMTCLCLLLLVSTSLFKRRLNSSRLIFCLYLLTGCTLLAAALGMLGVGVGASACNVLASYPRKADFLKNFSLFDPELQSVLVEFVRAGESGLPLAIPGYSSLLKKARESASRLPANSSSPVIEEYKQRTAELLADSASGFPSIPLNSFNDYFVENEAAGCGSVVPAWWAAILHQAFSSVVAILFLISLLSCVPKQKATDGPSLKDEPREAVSTSDRSETF